MPAELYPVMHLAGRILFSMMFIASGVMHLTSYDKMKSYAESKGLPAAGPATIVSGLMILSGGLMVLTGWHRFIGAGLLVVFLLGSAVMMHQFWKEDDEQIKALETAHFMKNISLAGAALLIAYYSYLVWPLALS